MNESIKVKKTILNGTVLRTNALHFLINFLFSALPIHNQSTKCIWEINHEAQFLRNTLSRLL